MDGVQLLMVIIAAIAVTGRRLGHHRCPTLDDEVPRDVLEQLASGEAATSARIGSRL